MRLENTILDTHMNEFNADKSWPFAIGGGATILLVTLLLATTAALWFIWPGIATVIVLILAAALWLLILYFFRDPNRDVLIEPGMVVSPGDGEIVEIAREPETRYLNTDVIRVSMFLSVLDVHIQRVPLAGEVTQIDHRPGKFLQAFKPEASEVNEYVGMVISSEYGRILVKQIAGILARRCVNYAKPGDLVKTGQRYGLIKFGSRIDLSLPTSADILVKVGDKAYGGLTPIARMAMDEG